jgi:tripartite-type tricarboxylate transporter receptor subunit TctC
VLSSLALLIAGIAVACAQSFPARPVHIVVPFPPGGTTDSVARILGEKLSEEWKQPVLVESKTGAGTTIAAAYVAGRR